MCTSKLNPGSTRASFAVAFAGGSANTMLLLSEPSIVSTSLLFTRLASISYVSVTNASVPGAMFPSWTQNVLGSSSFVFSMAAECPAASASS